MDNNQMTTKDWYRVFIYMGIPIFGWIYLFRLSKSKKYQVRKEFAKAFLFYKLTMIGVCILILIIGFIIALPYINYLLDYVEML